MKMPMNYPENSRFYAVLASRTADVVREFGIRKLLKSSGGERS